MKTLIFGDVVGRSGRDAVARFLPELAREHSPDFIIINADNAAGGFGVTEKLCKEFFAMGADAITGGDHIWDQSETISYIEREPRLLRPANLPSIVPGAGARVLAKNGKKLLLVHLLGQVFIRENADCPFAWVDRELPRLSVGVDAVVVDFHAEATSEKNAMGFYLDGKVMAVVGTHTHIPTADARILPQGTAYITDIGMCGDYNSVIGFEKDAPLRKFRYKYRKDKMNPATGEGTICAVVTEPGKITHIKR